MAAIVQDYRFGDRMSWVPQTYRVVFTQAGERLSIGAERQNEHAPLVPQQRNLPQVGYVEQLDRLVVSARSQPMRIGAQGDASYALLKLEDGR